MVVRTDTIEQVLTLIWLHLDFAFKNLRTTRNKSDADVLTKFKSSVELKQFQTNILPAIRFDDPVTFVSKICDKIRKLLES